MKRARLIAALPLAELVAVIVLVEIDLWLAWDRLWLQVLLRGLAAAIMVASFVRRRAGRPDATHDLALAIHEPGRRERKRAHAPLPTSETSTWPETNRNGKQPPAGIPKGWASAANEHQAHEFFGLGKPRAWLETAVATLVLGIAVLAWAAAVSGPFDEPNLPPWQDSMPQWLLHRVALVIVQQLVLLLFFWPVAREVLGSGRRATFAVALLFGLFHLPSIAFAVATAIGGGLWLTLYRRAGRLAPLIASHVVLAGLASTLPDRLFYDLKVGTPALAIAEAQRALASEDKQALLSEIHTPRYASSRGATDEGYIEGLYRDILGRSATEEEIGSAVDQLATISRLGLAKRMLLSGEVDDATLWHRLIDVEPLPPGIDISPDSDGVDFAGWYEAEARWRWAREPAPVVRFPIDRQPTRDYVLTISGGAATVATQSSTITVELELNGGIVGSRHFTGFAPRDHRFLVSGSQLAPAGDNTLRFLISGAPVVLEGDSRPLGFGLRHLRIAPLRFPSAAVLFTDDDYFLEGFSVAEKRLRWTLAPNARLTYPLSKVEPAGCYEARLTAGAFEHQNVGLSVNGQQVSEWTLDGLEPQVRSARFDSKLLRPGPNAVDFHLPGAKRPEGDPRQLGLAFISLRIYPLKDRCRQRGGFSNPPPRR